MFDYFKKKFHAPTSCRLEACSLCQLNCRTCPMRLNNSGKIGNGYLTAKNFEKFINLNPTIKEIELSNNGEIFLNPELVDIMRIAYEKHVDIHAYNGVNFNNVKDEVIDALVKYDFRIIHFSIDGASNESYGKYRINGNFDRVIENIKKLNETKKKYGKDFPIMRWQYVILPYNSSIEEIRKAKDMAKDLGMEIYFKKDWRNFIPKNVKEVEKETNLLYEEGTLLSNWEERWVPCTEVLFNPQVNWDGRFLGCCNLIDEIYDLNAFELSLEEILNSKEIKDVVKLVMGKYHGKEKAKTSKCYTCWFYADLCKTKKFITKKEFLLNEKRYTRKDNK